MYVCMCMNDNIIKKINLYKKEIKKIKTKNLFQKIAHETYYLLYKRQSNVS